MLRTTNEAIAAADLPGLSADLKRTSAAVRDTVHGEQMRKTLANAALASERLPALFASLQTTVQRAGNGTSDLQLSLVPLLRDLEATTQNLRELTDSLRRYPAAGSQPSAAACYGTRAMKRRMALAGMAALGGCSVLPQHAVCAAARLAA